MIFTPKVTIVIPVYNGSDYLSQAIDSALAQTYQNIEIVVVNDGSVDDGATEKVALSYGDKVRYFFKMNGGVGSALNVAINNMSGEYFSWLSHDDLYYSDKVESQVQALAELKNPKTILYGDFAIFSNNPDVISEIRLPNIQSEQFRYFLTVKSILHGCTLLVPKEAFKKCGLFNEELRTTQDYDLWFRLAKKYRFIHAPKLLVKARQHAEQGSVKMSKIALAECDELLTGFVEMLSDTEMEAATHSSISLSYAKISASMQYRGFYNAAKHASTLATKNLGKGPVWDDLKSGYVLIRIKYVDAIISKLRMFYLVLRAKAKKCLN
jgi:glycosyltransferase involved in cell wall biosynthesis